MDPASAIISAVLGAGTAVLDTINTGRAAKYDRLPDWLSPRDFQRRDYTIEIIIGSMAFIILIIVVITAWKARK